MAQIEQETPSVRALVLVLLAIPSKALASNTASHPPSFQEQYARWQSTLNNVRAISLVTDSPLFREYLKESSYKFNSIFSTYSLTTSGLVKWESVNVVFSSAQGNLVASEDTGLTRLDSVQQQLVGWQAGGIGCRVYSGRRQPSVMTPSCAGGGGGGGGGPLLDPCATLENPNWSGYEFVINTCSPNPVYPIYQNTGGWAIPSASNPSTGCSSACEMSVWIGIEDPRGATDGKLLQAGTAWTWDCGLFSCSHNYHLIYDILPSNGVSCQGASASDSVYVNIYSQYLLSLQSSDKNTYIINVQDNTSKQGCVVTTSYFQNTTPYYAADIVERQTYAGAYSNLAQFGSVTIANCDVNIYTPGAQFAVPATCSGMYGTGCYGLDQMVNGGGGTVATGGTLNISVGSVISSSDSFVETWVSSANT